MSVGRKSVMYFDNATLDGGGGSLGAVRNVQLFDNAVDVIADGVAADVQGAADLLIGEAASQHL